MARSKKIKGLSMRIKLTVWITLAMILLTGVMIFIFRYVSASVLTKSVREYLISAVESNADQVNYVDRLKDDDQFIYIEYGSGYIEVDADFLDVMNDVTSALYTPDGRLMYGENPLSGELDGEGFSKARIYKKTVANEEYYIYDRKLMVEESMELWLRGVVPMNAEKEQMSSIFEILIWFLPAIIIAAALGSYLIAAHMMSPIRKLKNAASRISGGDDLNLRIELGRGRDEIYELGKEYNGMLDRIEESFEREKRFTSDASHELRTPMSVISAELELTMEKERTKEEYMEALEVIARQSARMNILIEDMLAYTRLDKNKDTYVMEPLNLSRLVGTICEDMALLRKNGISLTYETGEELSVVGNEALLTRMLHNLIDNAYKYGRENGHIEVRLEEKYAGDERQILLSVKDDGIGISEENKTKVFDRFFRADVSRSKRKGISGNGLGLAMVAKIVAMHDAEISLESEKDKGSIFLIVFRK
ncbi:MAG: HAMP domain-containing histidine kinase [Eubacterium sp.]|nr:HAMP domain-containing histidine kinase [Eubacterium sp.]